MNGGHRSRVELLHRGHRTSMDVGVRLSQVREMAIGTIRFADRPVGRRLAAELAQSFESGGDSLQRRRPRADRVEQSLDDQARLSGSRTGEDDEVRAEVGRGTLAGRLIQQPFSGHGACSLNGRSAGGRPRYPSRSVRVPARADPAVDS